jgi:purine-binding chemotaxis protein CheW
VLDLRARLGIEAKALEPEDVLIVLGTEHKSVVVRVDYALGFQPPDAGDVTPVTLQELLATPNHVPQSRADSQSSTSQSTQAHAILERRARALAGTQDEARSETLEVATFELGSRTFALETRFLCRVVPPGEITPVPGTPGHLAGLVNLDGEVLTVFEPRPWFGARAEAERGDQTRLLVLGRGRPEFGLLVDDVRDVRTMQADSIRKASAALSESERSLLQGVTDDLVMLFDGAALLADGRLWIDQTRETA